MKFIDCFFILFFWTINGQLIKENLQELLTLGCSNPSVTLQVFSAKPNPVWMINIQQIQNIRNLIQNTLNDSKNDSSLSKSTERIMGYQGFIISCSTNNQIFIYDSKSLESYLLDTGRSYLSDTIVEHVRQYLGQSMPWNDSSSFTRMSINCDLVPIKGSDRVPIYNPQTGNGGCFVKKQLKNNCYAYGTNIVTNTFPQPGRHSGKKLSAITCEDVRKAAVLDGLVYNGTSFPNGHPRTGHFVALLIWPNADYHWIRKDANSYWSHKPGARPITNRDNTGSLITNPSKSNLSPWKLFCGYYIAQPSRINIR